MQVIATATNTVVATIPVGGGPGGLGGGPAGVAFQPNNPSPLRLSVNHGGNGGTVTLNILGNGIPAGVTASLVCPNQPVVLGTNTSVTSYRTALTTTFDLTGTSPGQCAVVMTKLDGSTVTVPEPFIVDQGGAPDVRISKIGTTPVPGYDATYLITLANVGNVDAQGGILDDLLDASFSLLSVTPSTPSTVQDLNSAGVVTCAAPPLGVGLAGAQAFSYQVNVSQNTAVGFPISGQVCISEDTNIKAAGLQILQCVGQLVARCPRATVVCSRSTALAASVCLVLPG